MDAGSGTWVGGVVPGFEMGLSDPPRLRGVLGMVMT